MKLLFPVQDREESMSNSYLQGDRVRRAGAVLTLLEHDDMLDQFIASLKWQD
jgi:hypothetical protein